MTKQFVRDQRCLLTDQRANHIAREIIKGCFVDPADRNYALARFCYHSQLYTDFWWNCAQAIEKISKAILLFNGHSVKAIGHSNPAENLRGELEDDWLKEFDPIPLGNTFLSDEKSPDKFFDHVFLFGSPDVRYSTGVTPWNSRKDLFYLDQTYHFLKRYCRTLDIPVAYMGMVEDGSDPTSYRQAVRKQLGVWSQADLGLLGQMMLGKKHKEMHKTLWKTNEFWKKREARLFGESPETPVNRFTMSLGGKLDPFTYNILRYDGDAHKLSPTAKQELLQWLNTSVPMPNKLKAAVHDALDDSSIEK